MKITGKVKFQNISGGFWGIIGDDGQMWRPESMPEELQKEDLVIEINAKKSKSSGFSIFMWGTAIKIVDYKVL